MEIICKSVEIWTKSSILHPVLDRPKRLEKRKAGEGNGGWIYESCLILIDVYYRSACHFQLKNYRECLTDIDLALEAGYPIQMCNKLYIRQCKCLLGSDFVLEIFSHSSHIFFHKRNWHNNKSQKLNNLHNFNSWMTITPILPSDKWLGKYEKKVV